MVESVPTSCHLPMFGAGSSHEVLVQRNLRRYCRPGTASVYDSDVGDFQLAALGMLGFESVSRRNVELAGDGCWSWKSKRCTQSILLILA